MTLQLEMRKTPTRKSRETNSRLEEVGRNVLAEKSIPTWPPPHGLGTRGWCEGGVYIVDAGPTPMCNNRIPNSCPRTLSSGRQSEAFSVQCEQAARTHPGMPSRSRLCTISDDLRALALFCHLSQCSVSGLLSHGRRHRCLKRGCVLWPAFGIGVVIHQFIWCEHVCLVGACLELGT